MCEAAARGGMIVYYMVCWGGLLLLAVISSLPPDALSNHAILRVREGVDRGCQVPGAVCERDVADAPDSHIYPVREDGSDLGGGE